MLEGQKLINILKAIPLYKPLTSVSPNPEPSGRNDGPVKDRQVPRKKEAHNKRKKEKGKEKKRERRIGEKIIK